MASDGRQYSVLMEGEVGQHKAPHVHIKNKGMRVASVEIETGNVRGEIPKPIERYFWEWLAGNKAMLLQDWQAMQSSKRPRTYEFKPF